jgi:thiol-disulfide isomerase/thioredoxin
LRKPKLLQRPKSPAVSGSTPNRFTLKNQHGRVVLLEFWTFACYNCRNTLPTVKKWDAQYRDKGLTIIGVHTPELDYERNVDNLRKEVAALGITYPGSY